MDVLTELRDEVVKVNNIDLHVKKGGKSTDPVIIFLHGFPEFWYGWKNQIAFFIRHNYQVIVPDLRGYNYSSKPSSVKEYVVEKTSTDIISLIKSLKENKVFLVGHDWGGVLAWRIAMDFPELLEKIILLNIPHPGVVFSYMKSHPQQLIKSSYIAFFQVRLLPEFVLKLFNHKVLEKTLITTSNKGTFSYHEIEKYKDAWKQPAAMKSMLHWYRALKYSNIQKDKKVDIPLLLIWGRKDRFLSEGLAPLSIQMCMKGTLKYIDDATHWLHHEKPDEVNKMILDFLE